MRIFHKIDAIASSIAQAIIIVYQHTISPDKGLLSHIFSGTVCCHEPHCSEFGLQSFRRYGFLRGLHYTMERVSSCTGGRSVKYDPPLLRVVFFSGSPIGLPFLDALVADKRFDLVGVVSQPAVASGRGMQVKDTVITQRTHEHAETLGTKIPVLTPHSLRKKSKKRGEEAMLFDEQVRALHPDVMLVVAYGNILPQYTLDIPHFGTINVHGSLLPKYRGASPLQSVFLADHDAAGVTIMKMTAGLDEGPILSMLPMPLQFSRTVKDLIAVMKAKAPGHCLDTIWDFVKGRIDPIPQDDASATHCGKIDKSEGHIDFMEDPLESVYKRYQAFALWPKVFGTVFGKKITIEQLLLDQESYEVNKRRPLLTYDSQGNTILNEAIMDIQVKPQGKKTMGWDAFCRGYGSK